MKWATAAILAAIVIVFMAAANEAYGADRHRGRWAQYRCHPVAYIKCWGPGNVPPMPRVSSTPRPAVGQR